MPKTYKNIGGTWYPIKKIYTKISNSWLEIKKLYKNVSGTWRIVHNSAVEYTFSGSITASASTGILLSNYVSPSSADVFNITINSGVVLSGKTGANGAAGANSSSISSWVTNCKGTRNGSGYNGNAGGNGGYGIDLTGFGGKTINFINYGTIKGGNGGNGGNGGYSWSYCYGDPGCGGAGGNGNVPFYNPNGAIVNITGNSSVNGSAGSTGISPQHVPVSCDCTDMNME